MIVKRSNNWFRAVAFVVALSLVSFQTSENFFLVRTFKNSLYAAETVVPTTDPNRNVVAAVPITTGEPSKDIPEKTESEPNYSDIDFLASSSPLSAGSDAEGENPIPTSDEAAYATDSTSAQS